MNQQYRHPLGACLTGLLRRRIENGFIATVIFVLVILAQFRSVVAHVIFLPTLGHTTGI